MGRRAVIVGGSLGGLFAAGFLQELGWQVDVYERVADELAARGAGIGTHGALFDALRRLGVEIDERLGIRVTERICLDAEGHTVHTQRVEQVMSHWARVYGALKARIGREHYHPGRNFLSYIQGAEVIARFDDGSEARGDLLIGADGLRSSVRAQLIADAEPRYAGYVAWRGLVKDSELPESLRQRLGDGYYFVLPPGEMMLCYLVPGRDWNYVWYRPTTEDELRDLCTDVSGKCHGSAISPTLLRPELTAGVKRTARAILAPKIAELVECSQPFFQAIYDFETPRMHGGPVALLGDAAFVARPHVGMGVTKAALDAMSLARSIELTPTDLNGALARYERLRSEFGRGVVRRSARIGAYIEARARPERAWTAEELDQSPERILMEVGTALVDIPELSLEI